MLVASIDIETRSECDLKACGAHKYAEHPSTRITVLGYTFDGLTVTLWIPVPITAELRAEVLRRCEEKYKGTKFVGIINSPTCPTELADHIRNGGMIAAWNAQFERVVLNGVAGEAVGFPKIEIKQTICTAAKAAAMGLPRGLGDAGKALGTHPKDEAGRFDMLACAKPRKPTKANPDVWFTPKNAPDKYANLYCYNADDVFAEYEIGQAIPDLSPAEQNIYWLDQLINQRGVRVDLKAIDEVQFLIDTYKAELAETCEKMTGPQNVFYYGHPESSCVFFKYEPPAFSGALDDGLTVELTREEYLERLNAGWSGNPLPAGLSPTQREKIADWIRANGWPQLEDLQAETVKDLVKNPAVPENLKIILKIYSTYNAKAVAKYPVMKEAACADGRLRGMFLYHGAGPGRWSALIVQLQNLFRPVIEDPDMAIEAFQAASLEWIRTLYPDTDPMKVFASCVRGMLIADEGHDLLYPDFAGIEARVNAWLWGEEWKLKAYREYDAGTGPDLYIMAYATAFGICPNKMAAAYSDKDALGRKKPRERWAVLGRQIGKVMELALGYEGGVGAFLTMVDTYGINLQELTEAAMPTLPDDIREEAESFYEWMTEQGKVPGELSRDTFIVCESLKRMWRRAHPKITQGWKDLKEAIERAVEFKGTTYTVADGKLMFRVTNYKGREWLQMRLPSGRKISYYKPEWIPPKTIIVKETTQSGLVIERERTVPGEMRYSGIDTKTRQWKRVTTYGGRADENAVQGISACLLRDGMLALEEGGYPLIGSVHDEPITEPKIGFGSMEEAAALMCRKKSWCPDLPLAVGGRRGPRYGK